MKIIKKTGTFFSSLFKGLWSAFDIRDIFVFGGLGMIGWGLYLFEPWIAYVVTGVLLMLLGLGWLLRRPAK